MNVHSGGLHSPASGLDALSHNQLSDIARQVFHVLEFGGPNGVGRAGAEWSSDTVAGIAEVFAAYGVTFTEPGHPAASDELSTAPAASTTPDPPPVR